ncbi:MAG: COG1361 S-layer family protein [Halobacteriaceae archaeon]
MTRRRLAVALVLVGLLAPTVLPAPAAADARGSPDLSATLPDDEVVAGEEATLAVQVTNDGDLDMASSQASLNQQVTAAQATRVEVGAGSAPLSVETATQAVGTIADGATRTVEVPVSVSANASPGRYRLPIEVTYSHPHYVDERTGVVYRSERTVDLRVTVEVVRRASFRVVSAGTDVRPGGAGVASVTVENVGNDAARATRLTLATRDDALVLGSDGTATRYLGRWAPGERRTVAYGVTAAASARRQSYAVEVRPAFEDDRGRPVTPDPLRTRLSPAAGRRFTVVGVESDVSVGDVGTATVRMRNDGDAPVTDAVVGLASDSPAVLVDGGPAASRYVGRWAPGETRALTYTVVTNRTAAARTYALSATVRYDTTDGGTATAPPASVGVDVAPDLDFAVRDVGSDLRVDREGTLRGTVVNEGPRTARDAVVVVESDGSALVPDPVVPVGDLASGEAGAFSVDVAVPRGVDPSPQAFSVRVRYADADGDRKVSDRLGVQRPVAPARDRLTFAPVNATFAPDTDNRLVVRVTNRGNETLTDLHARIRPTPPFESVAPESYVGRLDPGETATLAFEVTVDEDAVDSTHAVPVNVTADAPGDETVRVGPTLVPVRVSTETGAPSQVATFVGAVVVVAVVLAAGYWWLRR